MASESVGRLPALRRRVADSIDHRVCTAFVLVVATVLRGYRLGVPSIWIDEAFSVYVVSRLSVSEVILHVPSFDPHPPLYYAVLDRWVAVAGTAEWSVRAPSVVFGLGTVYLTYAVGRTLFDRRVGLVAALLLALSPFHVQYSRDARMYGLLVFLTVASLYCFVRLLDGEETRTRTTRTLAVGWVVASTLLLYTHVYAVFVLLVQGLTVVLWSVPGRWPAGQTPRRWTAGFAAMGIAASPWLATLGRRAVTDTGTIGHIDTPTLATLGKTARGHVGGLVNYPFAYYDASLTLSLVVGAGCLVLVGYSFVGYRPTDGTVDRYLQREYLLLAMVVVPVLLPYVISHAYVPIFKVRYTIVSQPALWILVAHGLTRIRRSWLQWVVAGLFVVCLVSTTGVLITGDSQEQWDAVAATVDENPSVPVFVTPEYADDALIYYTEKPNGAIRAPPPDGVRAAADPTLGPGQTLAETRDSIPQSGTTDGRFYVVTMSFDRAEDWLQDVRSAGSVIDHESHGRLDVYLVDGADGGLNATDDG